MSRRGQGDMCGAARAIEMTEGAMNERVERL